MKRWRSFVPSAAVEPIAVLGNSGKIENTEVCRAGRPILLVRGRLAKIVETCPHKFADRPGIVVLDGEIVIRQIAPVAASKIVGTAVAVFPRSVSRLLNGELVNTTA